MRDLLDSLLSLEWWFTVVFVSFVVNLAVTYIKPRLDGAISRFSIKRKERSDRDDQERLEVIKIIMENERAQSLYQNKEIRFRLYSVQFLLYSIFLVLFTVFVNMLKIEGLKYFVIFYNLASMIVAPILLLLAQTTSKRAHQMSCILREATGLKTF